MPTNTANGFPYPTSNEPVANGASNIGSLAWATDLKMGLYKVIPTGATNGTVSGDGDVTVNAGAGSVTVQNAFSSLFDNYRILLSGFANSVGGVSIRLQLNNSLGATYLIGGIYAPYGTTAINGYGPAAATTWTDIFALDTSTQGASADIYEPFLAKRTTFTAQSVRTGTGQSAWYYMTGVDTNAASNTGFILSPVAGTFTAGTIRIYGYRN
jgi:hypothetical protein